MTNPRHWRKRATGVCGTCSVAGDDCVVSTISIENQSLSDASIVLDGTSPNVPLASASDRFPWSFPVNCSSTKKSTSSNKNILYSGITRPNPEAGTANWAYESGVSKLSYLESAGRRVLPKKIAIHHCVDMQTNINNEKSKWVRLLLYVNSSSNFDFEEGKFWYYRT